MSGQLLLNWSIVLAMPKSWVTVLVAHFIALKIAMDKHFCKMYCMHVKIEISLRNYHKQWTIQEILMVVDHNEFSMSTKPEGYMSDETNIDIIH